MMEVRVLFSESCNLAHLAQLMKVFCAAGINQFNYLTDIYNKSQFFFLAPKQPIPFFILTKKTESVIFSPVIL